MKLKASLEVGGGAATGADEKSSKLKKSVGYDAGLCSGKLTAADECSSKPPPKLNISFGEAAAEEEAYAPISNPSKANDTASTCFFSSSFTGDFSTAIGFGGAFLASNLLVNLRPPFFFGATFNSSYFYSSLIDYPMLGQHLSS